MHCIALPLLLLACLSECELYSPAKIIHIRCWFWIHTAVEITGCIELPSLKERNLYNAGEKTPGRNNAVVNNDKSRGNELKT